MLFGCLLCNDLHLDCWLFALVEAEGGGLACVAVLGTTLTGSGQLLSAQLGNRLNWLPIVYLGEL